MYNLTVLRRKARDGYGDYGDMVEILTCDDNIEDIIKRFKKEVISGVAVEDLMIQKVLEVEMDIKINISDNGTVSDVPENEDNMTGMFKNYQGPSIDLSSFDTSDVITKKNKNLRGE